MGDNMNKKGFTLVELLAVVAILAILVVFVIPNVFGSYMDAKKSAFVSEAQKLYKTAFTTYTNDFINNGINGSTTNCFIESASKNQLSMTTGQEKYYKIKFDNNKIVYFYAYDKNYMIEIDNTSSKNEILVDQITTDKLVTSFTPITSCN